jgi:uridylate kinase
MNTKETIVISVGGSLIVPDAVDTVFLKTLDTFVRAQIASGRRFIIITGGGKTARRYQAAADDVAELTPTDLDWIGIHATRLNGHLLRTIFRDIAHAEVIRDPGKVKGAEEDVIIAAGWKPGCSTDYDAVLMAREVGAKKLINLSNIDYAYDKDPKVHPDAQPITETNWTTFRALLPGKWDPGLSAPFDPIAAREAEALHMEVAIINGTHLDEVEKYLDGQTFTGTRIQ